MADTTQFWDYLEGVETPEQYNCFASYRDMGPRRTLQAVAQWHQMSAGTLGAWAERCSWKERVADFDLAQCKARDELLAVRRSQTNAAWAERRGALLDQLEEVAALGAEQLLFKLKSKHTSLRPNELRLIIETLTKWQNLANGDATEKVDIGGDYADLSDEQLAQLEAIEQAQTQKRKEQLSGPT